MMQMSVSCIYCPDILSDIWEEISTSQQNTTHPKAAGKNTTSNP